MENKPTVADMMTAYAQDAVDHAKAQGVALDYSVDSLREVEAILAQLEAAMPKGFVARVLRRGPSREDIWTMAKMYGGYVGEVLRRAGGGEWVMDATFSPPVPVPCLRRGEQVISPPAKVHKRITNGAEENVSHYAKVLLAEWRVP